MHRINPWCSPIIEPVRRAPHAVLATWIARGAGVVRVERLSSPLSMVGLLLWFHEGCLLRVGRRLRVPSTSTPVPGATRVMQARSQGLRLGGDSGTL